MLSYFRQNDPFRIFGLIVLLFLTRLFFFLAIGTEATFDQIKLNGIETFFNEGAGPLFQLLSAGLSFILSNAYLNASFAALIILWNATLLNALLIRNSAFEDNSFIPSALYVILISFNSDNFFLTSQLLGTSFLLIAFLFLHQHLRFRNSDEKILSIGSTLALASLFHIPYIWLLVLILILFLFYSGTVGRRYLLLFWGLAMVLLLAWLPFLYLEKGSDFWGLFYKGLSTFQFNSTWLINIGIALALPVLISLKTSASNLAGMGMTNLQITVKRVFTWIGLFGILHVLFLSGNSASSTNLLIVSLSYFLTEHLLNTKKKWMAELTFSLVILLIFVMLYVGPLY